VLKLVLPFMCKSVYSHDQVQNASSSLVETDVDFATGLQDIDLRSFARLYLSRTGPSFWGRAEGCSGCQICQHSSQLRSFNLACQLGRVGPQLILPGVARVAIGCLHTRSIVRGVTQMQIAGVDARRSRNDLDSIEVSAPLLRFRQVLVDPS